MKWRVSRMKGTVSCCDKGSATSINQGAIPRSKEVGEANLEERKIIESLEEDFRRV